MEFVVPKSYKLLIIYVSITQTQTISDQFLDFDEKLIQYS